MPLQTRWYFAYGSNLHPERMRQRAAIGTRRCQPALLRDWRLAFNLATGIEFVEPAMANIVCAPGETVHGVAMELSDTELAELIASEGGTQFYRARALEVETYAGDRLPSLAFVANDAVVRNEVPPSKRYLDLLRRGARHHGLAEAYCAFLDAHADAPPSLLSPWVADFFAWLEHPRARFARDAFLELVHRRARQVARRARRRASAPR